MLRSPHSKYRILAAAAAVVTWAAPYPSLATSVGEEPTLDAYVRKADLVFRGVAEDIQYVMSAPGGAEGNSVPYTFVTFRVDSVMKGVPGGPKVTLRFLGGVDPSDGSFMSTDQTPLFDRGDEDILFATRSSGSLTPLVQNKHGRFRVLADQIYTDDGQEVMIESGDRIRTGKRYGFEEVLTTEIEGRVMRTESRGSVEPGAAPTKAVALEDFSRAIGRMVEKTGDDLSRAFEGANPGVAVQAPDLSPAAPPVQGKR